MTRILFVDDEPAVLSALKRTIRQYRLVWHAEFVVDGGAALERLRDRAFDVIVTDLQMPGMSGQRLLQQVSRSFPDVAQVILSGMDEGDLDRGEIGSTFQFLSKPCSAEDLIGAVRRGIFLKEFFRGGVLDGLLEGIGELSAVPDIQIRVREERAADGTDRVIAKIDCAELGIRMQLPIQPSCAVAQPV